MIVSDRVASAYDVLMHLAEVKCRMSAESLSKQMSYRNRAQIRRVCTDLASNGILRVTKGTYGGFELTRPPESINLYEIHAALHKECSTTPFALWLDEELEKHTLRELMEHDPFQDMIF
jgi:DNA-binding IscR family transcriptional regulator